MVLFQEHIERLRDEKLKFLNGPHIANPYPIWINYHNGCQKTNFSIGQVQLVEDQRKLQLLFEEVSEGHSTNNVYRNTGRHVGYEHSVSGKERRIAGQDDLE